MSGGLFNLFQMTQQEEDVLSLEDSGSEYFDTAEAGSSADEMEDCLSAVSEGVAEEVAQVRGQSPLDILRAGIANGQALYRRK